MVLARTRSFTVGLALLATLAGAQSALGQAQPAGQVVAPITSDERQGAERTALSDPRVRETVGQGELRVLTTDAEIDKGEAERFLADASAMPPIRRVVVVLFNRQTNKAARALVSLSENRVLAVDSIAPADVPMAREDADQALALAKASPDLRRAIGDALDQYAILDSASEERVPFAAQALPVRSSNRNDPCSVDRCLDLIFRTATGYLPWRAHVDLTRRTVAVHGGGQRR